MLAREYRTKNENRSKNLTAVHLQQLKVATQDVRREAATLIGNPQNMLIGETLKLSFGGYFAQALGPVLLGLLVTWGLIAWQTRGRWASPSTRIENSFRGVLGTRT